MSAGNFYNTDWQAHKLYTKTVATDYTVNVGGAAYGFIEDKVVIVSDPAANCTITVPDGLYVGQTCMVVLESNDNSKTVTLSTGTGSFDGTLDTAGQYVIAIWTGATTGWVSLKESVAS